MWQAGLVLLFLNGLCFQQIFTQSCIIYKKDQNGIYIGADTRVVSYESTLTGKPVESNYLSLCKIHQVNSINIAVTGYEINASLDEARSACEKGKLFEDAVKLYVERFGQKLADQLEADRVTKHDLFKTKFPKDRTVGGAILFQYKDDSLVGRVVKFVLVSRPSERATIATKTGFLDSIGIVGSAIGIHRVFCNKDVWKKGAVKGINNLIDIEKMANPSEVSGVADILFVSRKNEVEWIQRKKCL